MAARWANFSPVTKAWWLRVARRAMRLERKEVNVRKLNERRAVAIIAARSGQP
jgi:hypothetical protein